MISLRATPPYSDASTEISFEGPNEEYAYHLLAGDLLRLEWEVWVSRDGEDFWELGEEEEEE